MVIHNIQTWNLGTEVIQCVCLTNEEYTTKGEKFEEERNAHVKKERMPTTIRD
jgi:hypothetical protein